MSKTRKYSPKTYKKVSRFYEKESERLERMNGSPEPRPTPALLASKTPHTIAPSNGSEPIDVVTAVRSLLERMRNLEFLHDPECSHSDVAFDGLRSRVDKQDEFIKQLRSDLMRIIERLRDNDQDLVKNIERLEDEQSKLRFDIQDHDTNFDAHEQRILMLEECATSPTGRPKLIDELNEKIVEFMKRMPEIRMNPVMVAENIGERENRGTVSSKMDTLVRHGRIKASKAPGQNRVYWYESEVTN